MPSATEIKTDLSLRKMTHKVSLAARLGKIRIAKKKQQKNHPLLGKFFLLILSTTQKISLSLDGETIKFFSFPFNNKPDLN